MWNGAAPPLAITGTLAPGINSLPAGPWPQGTVYTSMFASPLPRNGQGDGNTRHVPQSYGAFARRLAAMQFEHGGASGLAARWGRASVPMARRSSSCRWSFPARAACWPLSTRRLLRIPGADGFRLADAFAHVESDAPLVAYDVGPPGAEATTIARTIAGFIDDGATVQAGLGKTPDALMRRSPTGKPRRIGHAVDGARILAEAGSLKPGATHVSRIPCLSNTQSS